MRLAIVGTVLAASLAVTGAYAQSQQTNPGQISGEKAFCVKSTAKIDCSYDTIAACQKSLKDMAKDSTSGGSCVSRSEAR
jgi:hypothetical protein